jgi:hypothetical protein
MHPHAILLTLFATATVAQLNHQRDTVRGFPSSNSLNHIPGGSPFTSSLSHFQRESTINKGLKARSLDEPVIDTDPHTQLQRRRLEILYTRAANIQAAALAEANMWHNIKQGAQHFATNFKGAIPKIEKGFKTVAPWVKAASEVAEAIGEFAPEKREIEGPDELYDRDTAYQLDD